MSTLRTWASTFTIQPGVLTNVLKLMKAKGDFLTEEEKLTVISFDETYISHRICYDKKFEKVYGPHRCVQTVVARGLLSNWKQPIFYNYDTSMTKELLNNIIQALHENGFNVIAIVSDMGSSNVGLWRDMGISITNTSFKHPMTNRNVHVFADVPHMLKLARNHFLDQ
ncbi:unnamed protein product [Macrosiphum euphorbiae]|nr:unnamed protein product [Macrosiphum euphorbiae]